MKKFTPLLIAISAFCVLCVCPSSVQAGTATSTMGVSVNVDSLCIVNAGNITFADYAPLGNNLTNPSDHNGSIVLTCTAGVTAVISLGTGGHNLAEQNRMAQGSNFLNYNLYQDGARTVPWRSGVDAVTTAISTDTTPRTYVVYGEIPAAQSALSGAYSDTVQVTVNY